MTLSAAWNEKFADLPILQLRQTMTDADVEAHTDLVYLRALLDDIVIERRPYSGRRLPVQPIPAAMSAQLAAALEELCALRRTPDLAAQQLEAWRGNGPGLRQQSEAD